MVAAAASPSVPVVTGISATATADEDDAAAESRETVCEASWEGLPDIMVVGLGAIGLPTVVITGWIG